MTEIPLGYGEPIVYPESDGEPMAETERHVDEMADLIKMLKWRFRDGPMVQVGGNQLMYYVEGDNTKSCAPDVYVTFGIPKGRRRVYLVWEEGKAPDFILEITSKSTRREDLHRKMDLYQDLGVQEYVLYDPLGEYLRPPLQAFVPDEDGELEPVFDEPFVSALLGIAFHVDHGALVLTDVDTGQTLLRYDQLAQRAEEEAQRAEMEARRAERAERAAEEEARRASQEAERAELEARRAESERARAESEKERAESEKERADALARELAELRARLSLGDGEGG